MAKTQYSEALDTERKLTINAIESIYILQIHYQLSRKSFTYRYYKLNVLESRFFEVQRKLIEFNVKSKIELKLEIEEVQSKVDELIFGVQQIYTSLKQFPACVTHTVESNFMFNANMITEVINSKVQRTD